MINGNDSSSRSTQQLATPGTGNLKGLVSGGADGGDKPPTHPCSTKSVHQLDGAGRGSKRPAVPTIAVGGFEERPFKCSSCEGFYISEEDLHCHIRRCHVPRSWRRRKEQAPFVEKRLSLGGHLPISNGTNEKGYSVVSKQNEEKEQEQKKQASKDAATEALAMPADNFVFDLNNPVPELEEGKRSSG
jgi:hypothetical protein